MRYKKSFSLTKAILINQAILVSHCSLRFVCITFLSKHSKKISFLKSTWHLNNYISFALKTKSGYSSDNVASLVMLIGHLFIVCLNLMTTLELQELCIKLLLSSLHFHPRFWLYRARFSLKYNLTSRWNASKELSIFLRSIFLFSAWQQCFLFTNLYSVFAIFSQMMTVF